MNNGFGKAIKSKIMHRKQDSIQKKKTKRRKQNWWQRQCNGFNQTKQIKK